MRGKKRVVLLGVAVLVATIIVAVIDATMIVRHEIAPKEKLPFGLLYWLMKGPWWWIVVPIILGLITGVGLAAFLLGRGCKPASRDLWGLVLVSLTPVIVLISGLFDLISATCIEYLRGRNPLGWMSYGKWWWTAYHPYPRLSSTLMGRSYCTWIDMLAGSLAGAALLPSCGSTGNFTILHPAWTIRYLVSPIFACGGLKWNSALPVEQG